MGPLVSIIIPTFNRHIEIKRAIESCFLQSYKNIEVVISDNSENNKTEEVIRGIKGNIVYTRNECNIGPILNWRNALDKASGDWVVIMPDDDFFINAYYIEDCLNIIKEHDVKVVFSDCILAYPDANIIASSNKKGIHDSSFILKNIWSKVNIPTIANFFNRELAYSFDIFYNNKFLYSDIELWLKILKNTQKCYFYDIPSIKYVFHDSNIVTNMNVNSIIENSHFITNVFDPSDNLLEIYLTRYMFFTQSIYKFPFISYALTFRDEYDLSFLWLGKVVLLYVGKFLKRNLISFVRVLRVLM
ncbi:hypothetical protein DD565_06525 [Vibrio cholerae]|uniref:glycosyltransferase family 2 protein n=1 Tax=Vibrio cholerae TaxID=666 RepID=UPI000D5D1B3A|nr:glycosyltransferase family 2 protein [Vibrio cholerae]PVX18379.1 hypothetical protein DD565_06525 [Vibrio cholerae]